MVNPGNMTGLSPICDGIHEACVASIDQMAVEHTIIPATERQNPSAATLCGNKDGLSRISAKRACQNTVGLRISSAGVVRRRWRTSLPSEQKHAEYIANPRVGIFRRIVLIGKRSQYSRTLPSKHYQRTEVECRTRNIFWGPVKWNSTDCSSNMECGAR
jgi:hypothetical protein